MNTSYSKCHCKDINMFNQIIYLIYVKCNFLFMHETHLLHFYHLQSFAKLVNCWISRINHCSTIFPILPKQLLAYCWISPLPGICVSPQAAVLLSSAEPRSWPGLAGMNGATPTEELGWLGGGGGPLGMPWACGTMVAHQACCSSASSQRVRAVDRQLVSSWAVILWWTRQSHEAAGPKPWNLS